MPPWPGSSGFDTSHRTTTDSPSLGCVENFASTLHWALWGMYSSRVLRLSRIVTLPIGWSPMLSKRIVKSTSSPGLAHDVEASLTEPQPRVARRRGDRVDRRGVVVLHLGHGALVVEDDLHGLGVRPGDGRRGAAGQKRHLRLLEHAQADDGQIFVGLEGVLEAPRADGAGHHAVALLGAHGHGRPGGDLVARLNVLLRAGGNLKGGRGVELLRIVNAGQSSAAPRRPSG